MEIVCWWLKQSISRENCRWSHCSEKHRPTWLKCQRKVNEVNSIEELCCVIFEWKKRAISRFSSLLTIQIENEGRKEKKNGVYQLQALVLYRIMLDKHTVFQNFFSHIASAIIPSVGILAVPAAAPYIPQQKISANEEWGPMSSTLLRAASESQLLVHPSIAYHSESSDRRRYETQRKVTDHLNDSSEDEER